MKEHIHLRKVSEFPYEPIREVSTLSPYHERVIMEKKYLQKKEELRSILIMGHLQKMQLNAINNRSIETIRKMRVAEDMSKRKFTKMDRLKDKRPTIDLRIDNRKNRRNRVHSSITQNEEEEKQRIQKVQKVYEELVDQYVKQISKEKLLKKGFDRQKLIDQACQTIKEKISRNFPQLQAQTLTLYKPTSKLQNLKYQQKQTTLSCSQYLNLPSISNNELATPKKPIRFSERRDVPKSISMRKQIRLIPSHKKNKKDHFLTKPKNSSRYRSLTQVQFNENLQHLKAEQDYLSKRRMRDEKLFLRKIQLIGAKNNNSIKRMYSQND